MGTPAPSAQQLAGHNSFGNAFGQLFMDMLLIAHFLNGLLMVAMPVGLAILLTRRFRGRLHLWGIGALTFVLSQVGHIPFNAAINPLFSQPGFLAWPELWRNLCYALFLGLSAGLFEELSRYAMFRWWAKDARCWQSGLLTGAGHGGIEAIILGVLVLYTFIQLVALRHADLAALVPTDKLALAQQQVTQYWSLPWAVALTGALERLFAIPCHLAMALLVMQTFTRRGWYWVGLAVLYHASLNAGAVLGLIYLGAYWAEAVIGAFAVLSLGVIVALRQASPPQLEPARPLSASINFTPQPLAETLENLENTRYQ